MFAALIGSPYVKPNQNENIVMIEGAQYSCVQVQSNNYNCSHYNPYSKGFYVARMFNPGQQEVYPDIISANAYYPYASTSFCWVNGISAGNVDHLSVYPWIFLYCPLLIILVFSFYTLYVAYGRFQSGVSMTLLHRLNILVLNYVNIFWFSCYWFILFLLLVIASTSKGNIIILLLQYSHFNFNC